MNEKYLQDLYGWIKSKDTSYEGRYSYDQFKQKMQDTDYATKMHGWIATKDDTFNERRPLATFIKEVGGSTPVKNTAINQQETVEEKPVKKKFALDSSSEDGSSVSQEPPKQQATLPELTQEGFKQSMTKKASVPTDMSGKPLFDSKKVEETKTMFKNIEKEKKQLDLEKNKYGDIFDKQLNIKPNVEESKYLKDRLSTINTDLINREEEYVVPELEYQFGDLGFKFEESGATGDYVKVTAPDGKTKIEISLDNFLDSKSKKQSEILQKFIKDNTPAKGLFVLENSMREQDKKFNSQKQVDDSVKVISDELNNLNAKQKQFLAKKSEFDKQLQSLGSNPDEQSIALLEKQRLALKAEMDALIKEEENIKQKSKKLDAAVGKYSISKSKQGTWGGGICVS